ncbi:TonB-dependent receptor [Mucilaginibacter sp.]|uniref:TonB-dependent receptor n=1 Tax=Mucilaginibacter sp. TaxID=1882438 RepID=UPI0026062824|nr:TonB-dependent receptor [Mucilaginibacter sp.]MDB4924699.1 TonB-dependent receptor [Mucilaginibacter sp.]
MLKIYYTLVLIFVVGSIAGAQTKKTDTTKKLNTVTVRGYLSDQPMLNVPASVSVISPAQLKLQPDNSLVSVMNTIPGIRMEERSPGSYRLSIRGSLLRSPFGIRDVKIYYDELPLTDAGGNTYLNSIDFNGVQGIEVLKGPDGSLFGANSGGVVLLNPVNRYDNTNFVTFGLNGGSYGLVHENVGLQNVNKNNQFNFNQSYETYHGYRVHSDMHRQYFQASDKITYGGNNSLKILGFYSDLSYETPGGLTQAQADADPTAARPSTPAVPGALKQNAGITNKMTYGGAVNEWHITDHIRNIFAVYGAYVNFTNPFITNYEQRYERTYGMRTYFEFTGTPQKTYSWKANIGLEWEQTNADNNDYGNRAGIRDTAQSLDRVNVNQHFIFARYQANLIKRLQIEAAASLNFYGYDFKNVYPRMQTAFTNNTFSPQIMPRVALSYQVVNNFIWRASVSRGYSTPTSAEIRPSNNIINTSLTAQYGWNYETGFRLRNNDESMLLDVSAFYYRLNNAIVRRLNPNGTEYYTNSGDIKQPGLELYFTDWIIKQNDNGFIRGLQINESLTISKFTFGNYHDATTSYQGKELTGVPRDVTVESVQVKFPESLYLYVEHNYTARIPLNEANTFFAPHYNLVKAKMGWQYKLNDKSRLEIYAGVDNLLNEKYSLGDDLDAVGNRFYNPSPLRNYYAGFNVKF